MRFIPLLILMILGLLFWKGLSNDPRHLPSVLIGKPAPTLQQAFRGKTSLFNVWATWCPACEEEHDALMQIAQEGHINIIGLNYKDELKKAEAFLKKRGNPYNKLEQDPDGRIGIEWGVYGAPETFFIDEQGIVRYRHTGTLTYEDYRRIIAQLKFSNSRE
ncbi:MAG: DsbE family thiol:disulfide interchange protein [Gammaproteobacteria bacterium]